MDQLSDRLARLSPEKLALLMERLREKESGRAPAPSIPRRPGTGPAPLSFAQERLWFIDQMEPGNPAYNELGVTRLEGALDVEALGRALDAVVERHDALRTVFAARGGEPEQVVVEGMRVPLDFEDLSALPPEEAEAAAERRVREEPARPFDLARGPLLRATLLRLAPERHLLLLAMHHVVSDGWSRGVIVREVSEAYAAFAAGAEPRLPEPPVRYADYAAWQRERLRGELLERQLGYWTAKLAGAPPSLELPTDRPRPPVQSFAGGTHRFRVPAPVADALRVLAREEEATLFMVLLAAWKTLLARYAGETDLVVGTPVANRGRAETEGLVGFLANTLALRTDLGGDPAFREALRRVRGTALGAYEHEELPFGVLVAELHPERDLSRPPLCQVMFLLDSAPPAPLDLPGVRLVPVEADTGISAFDLTLRLAERDGAVDGALEYAAALWDAPTVARMAAAFRALLEDVAASPDRRISELSILPAGERGRLLGEWSPGERGEPGEPRLHARFRGAGPPHPRSRGRGARRGAAHLRGAGRPRRAPGRRPPRPRRRTGGGGGDLPGAGDGAGDRGTRRPRGRRRLPPARPRLPGRAPGVHAGGRRRAAPADHRGAAGAAPGVPRGDRGRWSPPPPAPPPQAGEGRTASPPTPWPTSSTPPAPPASPRASRSRTAGRRTCWTTWRCGCRCGRATAARCGRGWASTSPSTSCSPRSPRGGRSSSRRRKCARRRRGTRRGWRRSAWPPPTSPPSCSATWRIARRPAPGPSRCGASWWGWSRSPSRSCGAWRTPCRGSAWSTGTGPPRPASAPPSTPSRRAPLPSAPPPSGGRCGTPASTSWTGVSTPSPAASRASCTPGARGWRAATWRAPA